MKKRILSAAVALLMSLVCLIPGSPIQAASTNTTTTFDKYLVLNQDANVPNVTFTFSIAAGAALDATSTTPRIEAGIGTPVIGSATFGPTDTTYTTVQCEEDCVGGFLEYQFHGARHLPLYHYRGSKHC